MKRYSFGLDSDANWWVFESKQGDYYRRDDLIAAGCLVPVPVGEECEYWHKKPGLCMKLGKVYGNSTEIAGKYDIVQPVKLLTLAELEADHG